MTILDPPLEEGFGQVKLGYFNSSFTVFQLSTIKCCRITPGHHSKGDGQLLHSFRSSQQAVFWCFFFAS